MSLTSSRTWSGPILYYQHPVQSYKGYELHDPGNSGQGAGQDDIFHKMKEREPQLKAIKSIEIPPAQCSRGDSESPTKRTFRHPCHLPCRGTLRISLFHSLQVLSRTSSGPMVVFGKASSPTIKGSDQVREEVTIIFSMHKMRPRTIT